MQRVLTADLLEHAGERVTLAGWLHNRRDLSHLTFLVIRDCTGLAQIVLGTPELVQEAAELGAETVLHVHGNAVESEQAPGGVEVHADAIEVVSQPTTVPPIELRRPRLKEQLPTLLDHAPVSLRHPTQKAKFAMSAATMAGYRETLTSHGFTEIQSPKIVASATESGSNVFRIDYFGRPAYLAQSPQFYKQIMVGVFERVFEVGPVFRAEPHETARHISEYVSLDAEMGFIEDYKDVMKVARDVVAGMSDALQERASGALELLGVEAPVVPEEIPVIDFEAGQHMIEEATDERVVGEPDLAPAHERWLGEWARREHGSDFVFVTGYPMAKRPFYTYPSPDRPDFSNSFDLVFRGVELITGGQRLHKYEDYLSALSAAGQSPEPFESYLETFRFGMPPHGGFAIGLERWLSRVVDSANIREVTLFPRDRHRLEP